MWITCKDFENLTPINVFHKEKQTVEITTSAFFNYHMHFTKSFEAERGFSYTIQITADDYYKLYINGSFVCQGPAPAYCSDYKWNEVDISKYIKSGTNHIAVHVYYQGEINRVFGSGDNRSWLWCRIIENENCILESDESWLYKRAEEFSGDTTGYKTQYLENIDFNKKDVSWKYGLKNGFSNAVLVKNPDWVLSPFPTTPLSVYKIKPKNVKALSPTSYLLDFGSEITGQVYFKAQGAKGVKVIIKHAEELAEDGTARYNMRCNCDYFEECTLSGDVDEFEFFDYKAFRYVQLESERDVFLPDTFSAIVRHAPFTPNVKLSSDIPYLENIWSICQNAVKYSSQESFLDCPSREKGQYLGDFTVSGLAYLYLTANCEMYKKTLFDFASSASVCKGIMAVAPGSFMQEIASFSLQYPLQVLNYLNATDDIQTAKELLPVIDNMLSYFSGFTRSDGLIENLTEKWNLVDWPKNLRDDYCVYTYADAEKIPVHNVINAFYIGAYKCRNKIAEKIGEPHIGCTEKLEKSFINVFYSEKTGLFYDDENHTHSALHSCVLPLFFDIAPRNSHETLKNFIMDKGLSCGVMFSYFVLRSLGKIGAKAEELSLILNESEHGWVNMLREGATTCFEAWGKEQKWNTSLCHPWASAPVIAILEDILNLSPKEILNFNSDITINLPKGTISLEKQTVVR